tara:strand:+ start:186 stop:395 length:210 start_codon:yes stop_codon:yes gene_type:complete
MSYQITKLIMTINYKISKRKVGAILLKTDYFLWSSVGKIMAVRELFKEIQGIMAPVTFLISSEGQLSVN